MSGGADGQQEWRRLQRWLSGRPEDDALDALADVGAIRRLLDAAELEAVRAARRGRSSWAEIATRLGVSRQSAWEKWRELDEEPVSEGWTHTPPSTPTIAGARQSRRDTIVEVPDVTGMHWDTARLVLRAADLTPLSSDPDGPPLAVAAWPDGLVVAQAPAAGELVKRNAHVTLWIDSGGGGAGVREPRRPAPQTQSGRAARDELTGTG